MLQEIFLRTDYCSTYSGIVGFQSNGSSDRISFANNIMVGKEINKGEKRRHYNIKKRKKRGSFDILDYISEHVALVQLMYEVGNVSYAVSITEF